MKYHAFYCPVLPPGAIDPSEFDFSSEEEAFEYVFSKMCRACQEGRIRALLGTSDPNNEAHEFDSLWPGCACEWEVLSEEEYKNCILSSDLIDKNF